MFAVALVLALLACAAQGAPAERDTTAQLDFKPPADMYKKFPYYWGGSDKEGRPVIFWELGKWDMKPEIEAGGARAEAMEKYMTQLFTTFIKMGKLREGKANKGIVIVADFDGFGQDQMDHKPTVDFMVKNAAYLNDWEKISHATFILNGNEPAGKLLELDQPIAPGFFANAKIYPATETKWKTELQEVVNKDQIPLKYGGVGTWKPVQVFGKGEPIDESKLK